MIPHAPSDATFASLLVGLVVGLSFAVGSYVSLTQSSWHAQFDRLVALLAAHSAATWLMLATTAAALAHLGWTRAKGEVKLKAEERLSALKRNIAHLPAHFPNGWYKLCDSDEIEIAATKHVALLNKDVALFRAAGENKTGLGRGVVHVVDAICPHLGANMGHGGKVAENSIECPFHGWQFSGTTGVCTKIPYAAKIPPNAKTGTWDACEVNGAVYLWYDVDFRKPTWHIPSHTSSPTASHEALHGRLTRDVPGNIQELVNKHADSWSGDLVAQQDTAETTEKATPQSVYGFAWAWSRVKSSWTTSIESPMEATLDTSAQLAFLGVPVPFGRFTFRLHHVGPSLVYTSVIGESAFTRVILGEMVLSQSFRPDSPFVNTVEWTMRSKVPFPPVNSSLPSRLVQAIAALPLRRAAGKLVLHLMERRFVATILPLYTLRKLNLSLHNSGGARDAFTTTAEDTTQEQDDHVATISSAASSSSTFSSGTLSSRAAITPASSLPEVPRPVAAAAAATAATAGRATIAKTKTVLKGYAPSSTFFATFWRTFYSTTGTKRQDDLTW